MFGIADIGKFIGAAKSISDILNGKADSQDYMAVYDTATDVLETFVPAAAPIIAIADRLAPRLIPLLNKENPGSGDAFGAQLEQAKATMAKVVADAEAITAAVNDMSDAEFDDLVQKGF